MSGLLTNGWPVPTDDPGTGDAGTGLTETFWDAARTAIDSMIVDAGNPTVTPATIIAEVVAARQGESDLSAKIDALESLISAATASGLTTYHFDNLCANSLLWLWSQGDSAAPDFYTLAGAGATIARVGTGLGDTQRLAYGSFACLITYGSSTATLTQQLLDTTAFPKACNTALGLKGRKISIGCYIKPSVANIAKICIYDGVTTTKSSAAATSTNGSWVTVTHTISNSATELSFFAEVSGAGSAYFGAFCPTLSNSPSADWVPEKVTRGFLEFSLAGNQTTGTKKAIFTLSRPGIVTHTLLTAETPPTGAALVFDINTWDGATYTTMYTTKPQIAIGASIGGAAPDGTYARRCLTATYGTTLAAGGKVTVDIDTIGSGTAGADVTCRISVLFFGARPLEQFMLEDDV